MSPLSGNSSHHHLQQICATANSLKRRTQRHEGIGTRSASTEWPTMILPEYQIYSCLRDIGASEGLAVRISASFEHYFTDLKHRTEALVAKTLSQLTAVNSLPSGWHTKVINTHVSIFQKRVETWKSDALDKVRRHLQRTRECRGTKSRKNFNPVS